MQFRNKALAGVAVMIALAGCASQEKKKTVSENDAFQQQKAQLAYQQQMAFQRNMAAAQGGACKNQAAGQVPEAAPPSCNCSCSPEGSKSSVETSKGKATATTKKSHAVESLVQ